MSSRGERFNAPDQWADLVLNFMQTAPVPGVERVSPRPIKCYTTASNGLKTSGDLNSPTLLSRLAPDTALRTDGSDVAIKS